MNQNTTAEYSVWRGYDNAIGSSSTIWYYETIGTQPVQVDSGYIAIAEPAPKKAEPPPPPAPLVTERRIRLL